MAKNLFKKYLKEVVKPQLISALTEPEEWTDGTEEMLLEDIYNEIIYVADCICGITYEDWKKTHKK